MNTLKSVNCELCNNTWEYYRYKESEGKTALTMSNLEICIKTIIPNIVDIIGTQLRDNPIGCKIARKYFNGKIAGLSDDELGEFLSDAFLSIIGVDQRPESKIMVRIKNTPEVAGLAGSLQLIVERLMFKGIFDNSSTTINKEREMKEELFELKADLTETEEENRRLIDQNDELVSKNHDNSRKLRSIEDTINDDK